jgi:hypothetical protein
MAYIGTTPKDIRSFGKAKFDFTATQGQTAFTGSDDDGKTLGFTTGQITVYLNGILLDESDYTASGSNTVTLASAANAGDILSVVALQTDIPHSDYVPATGGTFSGAVVANDGLTVTKAADGDVLSLEGPTGNLLYQEYNNYNYLWNLGNSLLFGTYASEPLRFGTANAERMRLDEAGNLLLAKTSATGVTGTGIEARADGRVYVTSGSGSGPLILNRTAATDGVIATFAKNGTTVGSISVASAGTTYNTTSDRRLKTDIQPIADATDKLMAMNPVSHKWKADPEADAVVGFIAQEMQEIVPEAVSGTPDGEEMMAMDYGRITPVLVAALQDAHKKIEALEERLAVLEAN